MLQQADIIQNESIQSSETKSPESFQPEFRIINGIRVFGFPDKASLIDFISTLPELATKAATRGNILHGFYESGLIDRTKSRYPVLLKVLGTYRSTLPIEVYQSVIDNFTHLYRIMMEQGRIPKDVFDDLGFPHNKDVYGHEVLRAAGISQESYQRYKCLTHKFQIDLCKECIEQIENDQRHKADQMQQKQN